MMENKLLISESDVMDLDISKANKTVLIAFIRGYRVDENGVVTNPDGRKIEVKLKSVQNYPTFTLNIPGISNSNVFDVKIHKLAAYCFYGNEMFQKGIVVRHLNANVLDVRKSNIKLGTYRDNMLDRSPEMVKRTGNKKGWIPHNRKLNEQQIKDVKRLIKQGVKQVELAEKYGVSKQTINQIKKGDVYGNV